MTEEELREAHREHVKSVQDFFAKLGETTGGRGAISISGGVPILYKDFDDWKAETERQQRANRRRQEEYEAGMVCLDCGCKDFSLHGNRNGYGMDAKCKSCGKIERIGE